MDAIHVGEHSFTEWGIQYWPVKLTIPIGAALLLLQGISKLIKDIMIVTRRESLSAWASRSVSNGSRLLLFGSLGAAAHARPADGVLHRQPRGRSSCIVFGNGAVLNMLPSRIFPFMTDYQLSAVPLFIFMAAVLEKAGIIEELFDVIYKWLGSVKGGLASATVVACTLLAAMVGVVGATEVTMGMIALPAMLRRGYEPKLACGALLAGGTLGILIPPSVMAIVYAVVAQQSLGELLIGSVFPGLLLSGLYIAYVTIRCYINPALGPALPVEERVDMREKLRLLRNTITPVLLIMLVLGVIFFGIATPVEAAGIGTFGALVVCALHRRLTWVGVQEAAMATLKATAMVMWIFFGATMFVGFFIVKGGQTFVSDLILGTGLPPYGILFLMMFILFILGHVPRLGRHPAADGADLPADPEEPAVRRAVRHCRASPGASAALVRRHLHGQHADGVPESAVRLFAVLPEERRAEGDHDGDDLQGRRCRSSGCRRSDSACASSSRRSSCGCRACCTRVPSSRIAKQRPPGAPLHCRSMTLGRDRPPLAQRLRERADVDVLELAADRHAAREPVTRRPRARQQLADVVRRRLALVGEVGREDHLGTTPSVARLSRRSRRISFGPMPSSGDSRPISTK